MAHTTHPLQYDDDEALDILARDCEALEPDRAGRENATHLLLSQVEAMGGRFDFRTQRQMGGLNVAAERVGVRLLPRDYGIALANPNYPQSGFVEVHLDYNPRTRLLEGKEDDMSVQLVPGQRRPRRNALAVVLEAVGRHLRSLKNARENPNPGRAVTD